MSLWLPNSGWCLSVFSFFRLSHRTRDKKWCDYLCVCHEPSLGPITFYWKALAAFNKWNISAEIFKNMREIGSEKKGRITLFYGLRHILGVHVTLCCRVMTQESLCSLPYNPRNFIKFGGLCFITKHAISKWLKSFTTNDLGSSQLLLTTRGAI